MRLSEEQERPLTINLVPMIDVIFAVLAFFIISTLFLTRSEGLPVNLPQSATAEVQTKTQITVTIQNDGAIALNQDPIALSELESGVRALLEPDTKNIIVLKADKQISHGRVVAVMDRLRRVEEATLAIATERPKKSN